MKMRVLVAGALVAAWCAALAPSLSAQEKKEEKKAPAASAKAPAKKPSQEEMMKIWQEVATPGEAHKKLEPFVGSFEATVKSWMDPSKPPEESTATSENKWVLGNRFVEQRVEGTMMGQPFTGIGYTGYDNYKKKYVGVWMDSAGTAMMTSEGTMDPSGKTFTTSGKMDDFVMKKTVTVKSKVILDDDDHHTMEMWSPGPNGKDFKVLEIHYTRKK